MMASQVGSLCGGSARTTRRRQGAMGGPTVAGIGEVTWRPRGDGRFRWFEPQNHPGGWFPNFGRKTEGSLGAVKVRAEGTRLHLGACFEAKGSRGVAVPVQCVYKNLDSFAPAWVVILEVSLGIF